MSGVKAVQGVGRGAPLPKWLSLEEMATELLIFAQPKLGLCDRRFATGW
jgi:hypothetical protein